MKSHVNFGSILYVLSDLGTNNSHAWPTIIVHHFVLFFFFLFLFPFVAFIIVIINQIIFSRILCFERNTRKSLSLDEMREKINKNKQTTEYERNNKLKATH